jgi:hypothetical protein
MPRKTIHGIDPYAPGGIEALLVIAGKTAQLGQGHRHRQLIPNQLPRHPSHK